MLDKRNQDRAINLNDGGRADRDAVCAKIAMSSRFVRVFRAGRLIAIAGIFAIYSMAGLTLSVTAKVSSSAAPDRRLVLLSSDGCALSVAEGADNVSDPASNGAQGSGSQRNYAPGELCLGNQGQER